MGDFGDNLRHEREARGVALEEISTATKISVRLLQAIENEEFDRLPGGVFNINFVRQYARHLGLDEEKTVGEFRRLTTPLPEPQGAQKPAMVYPEWSEASREEYDWDRQRQSQIWMLATFVVLAIGVTAGIYLLISNHRRAAVSPTARAAQTSAPAAGHPESMPPEGAAGSEAHPESPAAAPALAEASARPAGGPAAGAASAPAALAEAPSVGVAGAEAAVRVEIRTTGVVWISAVADGQVLFQRTLQPHETRVMTAKSTLRLRVGDAGALSLTLNGQPQPSLGPKGQVRVVVLTARGMEIVPPPPKEPAPSAETPASAGPGRGQPDVTGTGMSPSLQPQGGATRPRVLTDELPAARVRVTPAEAGSARTPATARP